MKILRMKLTHTPKDDFDGALVPITYMQVSRDKPNGLWVSADNSWEKWCLSNCPEWMGKRYRVKLPVGMRILRIRNHAQLLNFSARYRVEKEIARELSIMNSFYIDWATVAKQYDGIVIRPYVWAARLDSATRWYYGWDCASGCIWNRVHELEISPIRKFPKRK